MTKLQVVEVNQKDVEDIALLLSEHELARGPVTTSTSPTSGRSSTTTGGCGGPRREHSSDRRRREEWSPPGARLVWRARGRAEGEAVPDAARRIGERKRWYELPDEIK